MTQATTTLTRAACGAAIDRAAPPRMLVLRDVRRHAALAARVDEVARIVGLVGTGARQASAAAIGYAATRTV